MQSSADQTNESLITGALLFPYTKSVGLYKCAGNPKPMLRGVSLNWFMGALAQPYGTGSWKYYQKLQAVRQPSKRFVTIDEYEITINDAACAVRTDGAGRIMDWPALYHGNSSGMSFADGHSELHRWKFLGPPAAGYTPFGGGTTLTGSAVSDVTDLQNFASEP
jgi:prepilin-type processing-associated H-X9-DG protein